MKKFLKAAICMVGVVACLGLVSQAQADQFTVDFTWVSNNSGQAFNISQQLTMTVMDQGSANTAFGGGTVDLSGGRLLFVFENDVGIASSISEIYFDDGTIVSQSQIYNSLAGFTAFTGPGANPDNLPGGNTVTPPFVATQTFSADAVGNPANGVDTAADILGISYVVSGGLAGVFGALDSGALRVGLHLRAIGPYSDSFVNRPPNGGNDPVPEPATMFLLGTGLIGAAGAARRKKKNQA